MLGISLAVKLGGVVHLAELSLDLSELALEVIHLLLVTSVLTLGQFTLRLCDVLLTTNISTSTCA